MARHTSADDLGMIGLTWLQARLEFHRVMAIHAIVGGGDMLGILTQNRARGDCVGTIMARQASAQDLRMIYCKHRFELHGVMAAFAGVCGENMRTILAQDQTS